MGDSDPDTAAGGVVGKMVGQEGGLSAAVAATEAEWPFLAKMCSMLWGVVIDLEVWLLVLLDIRQWNW